MSFIENLNWRYATKEFDGREIPLDVLKKIFAAIQFCPSSFGLQPYRVVVIKNGEFKEQLNSLSFWNQKQIKTCSHLLIFCADLDIEKRAKDFVGLMPQNQGSSFDYEKEAVNFAKRMGAEWTSKQAYIALGFALAACAELKIDSCPMEAANFSSMKKILELPQNLEPKVLLAIGYRSPNDKHSSDPKIRFDKKDLFFIK